MSKCLFHWIFLHYASAFLPGWIPNRRMDFAGRLLLLFNLSSEWDLPGIELLPEVRRPSFVRRNHEARNGCFFA